MGSTEWQAPDIKTYASRRSIGMKNGDAGSLKSWIWSGDGGFGSYGGCLAGIEMGYSYWEILVKVNL